jgi:hypothetical protein
MRKASGAARGTLPKSLRERLALLQHGLLPVAQAGDRDRGPRGKIGRRVISRSFGLGLACGAALGCATLFVVLAVPDETHVRHALAGPEPGAQLPASLQRETTPSFEMILHRDQAGKASLPLRGLGVDDSQSLQVTLRNLPAGVRLSGGQRQDEQTWVLRVADLEGLQLLLSEGMPEAFDMTVEVATPAGSRLAEALAHVRLTDRADAASASSPSPLGISGSEPVGAMAQARPPSVDTPFQTRVEAMPRTEGEMRTAASARPPLPEGLSGLGGPRGGPAVAPPESRAVWWKLPMDAWSPFAGKASGN